VSENQKQQAAKVVNNLSRSKSPSAQGLTVESASTLPDARITHKILAVAYISGAVILSLMNSCSLHLLGGIWEAAKAPTLK